MRQMTKLSLYCLLPFLLLAGCADKDRIPILASSICSANTTQPTVFKDPGFSVRGATRRDQQWISSTQEAGIRACGWKRPPARAKVLAVRPTPAHKPVSVVIPAAHPVQPNVNEPPEPDVKVWPADPATMEATDNPPPKPTPPPKKKHFWQKWQKQQKASPSN